MYPDSYDRMDCHDHRIEPGRPLPIAPQFISSGSHLRIATPKTTRLDRRVNHDQSDALISRTLDDVYPDPGNVLERTGLLGPHEFWRFYHLDDSPQSPAAKKMGSKWGEMWSSYLMSDPLVLLGAVPLVLQKKSQLIGSNEDRAIRIGEANAIGLLRERMLTLDEHSIGGLVMAICGRVQIAIQQGEASAASMHMQGVKTLLEMCRPTSTEWLCSAWSDLRVVSSTRFPPILPRSSLDEWKESRSESTKLSSACLHLAIRNVLAFKIIVGNQFDLVCSIFKRLHQFEAVAKDDSVSYITSMQLIYETVYDCCLLHSHAVGEPASCARSGQLELLAICLKLCAWEKASYSVPRGGEIERGLLQRALQILGRDAHPGRTFSTIQSTDSRTARLWMVFTLAATAWIFAPDNLQPLATHLQQVTQLSPPSAIRRALKGWPTAPWWHTKAVHHICHLTKPARGSWQVLIARPDIPDAIRGGMRLKLLVIEP